MKTDMDNSRVGQFRSFNTLVLLLALLYSEIVSANTITKSASKVDPSDVLKTVESKSGEIIDCVYIHKQPSLKDPLFKNHTIQMKPNLVKGRKPSRKYKDSSDDDDEDDVFKSWYKNGEHCPEGTIPIIRSLVGSPFNKTLPLRPDMMGPDGEVREYCLITTEFGGDGEYYGASGEFSVWKPLTYDREHSISQLWVLSGPDHDLNTIETGWIVRAWASDYEPSFFIYWTRDYHRTTGCYNLECTGFVQISHIAALGTHLTPSTLSGEQRYLSINVHMEMSTGNWWLNVNRHDIGYWPPSIFTALANKASEIHWGGEIINSNPSGFHTLTQMGSGRFPTDGPGLAANIKWLSLVNEHHDIVDANQGMNIHATRPECYNAKLNDWNPIDMVNFYYGGPGGESDACQH